MPIQSLNPATGKVLKTFKAHKPQEINRVLQNAKSTFHKWRDVKMQQRLSLLSKVGKELLKNKSAYAKIITLEMGKPITQAVAEIEKCALLAEYYSKNADNILKEEQVEIAGQKSYIRFDPLGVVLLIMPWNFPFWQAFRAAIPAIAAGNTIVLKHASNVPQSAFLIAAVFKKAGAPSGLFQTLLIEGKNVEGIIADQRIAAVSLTGGTSTGQQVAKTAAEHLKKTVLELGGSDPFIVLKDADLKTAAKMAAESRLLNAGQSCISAKRFIVEKTVAEKFIPLFVAEMKKLKVGNPLDETTQVGALAREDLLQGVHDQVMRSVQKGAKVLLGGKRLSGTGSFYAPTILGNVKKGMPAYDEEIFGPVANVIIAKDEQDAIRIANDTEYGLGANIWTRNTKKGEQLARHIDAGSVFINGYVRSDPRLPFGGVKKSGYGREMSTYGLKEFTNIKTVVVKK